MPLLAPSLTVSCDQTALTAAWSVVLPEGVSLAGFSYTVQFSGDEEEINADVGPDVTTAVVPGFGEVITFILVARYTVGDNAIEQQSPSAIASCGIPNSPTNLIIACLPDSMGTGSTASASWIAPDEVSGLEFQRYEWTWLFNDELTTRTGQITDQNLTSVSSLDGDFTQGETARFSLYAVYIDTNADPNVRIDSTTITGNAYCPPQPPLPVLTVICTGNALNANWTIVVPSDFTLVRFLYTIILEEGEEVSGELEPAERSVTFSGSGEVLTFVLAAVFTYRSNPTEFESAAVSGTCGIPNPPTNLMLECLPESTGSGSLASASWTAPVPVSGMVFLRYEWEWLFDADASSSIGTISDRITTTVSSQSGDYTQGETARFSVAAAFLDTNAEPDGTVVSIPLTGNVFCTPVAPIPVLTVTCSNAALNAVWTIEVNTPFVLSGFRYTVIFEEGKEVSDTLGPNVRSLLVTGSGEVLTFVLVAIFSYGDHPDPIQSAAVVASCGIPNPPTNLMVVCVPEMSGNGSIATASWTAPVSVRNVIFQRYEFEWLLSDDTSTRTGEITDRTDTETSSQSGDYAQGETARFSILAVFLDTNADPNAMVNSVMVSGSAFCAIATPTPTLTVTPVPLPGVDGLEVECLPGEGRVTLNIRWDHVVLEFRSAPYLPMLTRQGYILMGEIDGMPTQTTPSGDAYNIDILAMDPFVVEFRIRALYTAPNSQQYLGPWSDYVLAQCQPFTPTPTATRKPVKLPLIEPQPFYFEPTLPPTIWRGSSFSAHIRSHHIVIVITQPGGHVGVNTQCVEQENIGRFGNGDVVQFFGCSVTSGPRQVEVIGIWPKDGRTLLFQHWIEVHARNTSG